MRVLPGPVRVSACPGGAVVEGRDWPCAGFLGGAMALLGIAVCLWSVLDRRPPGLHGVRTWHPAEFGGGIVFLSIGTMALGLSRRMRRRLTLVRDGREILVRGTEGSWPWRRPVEMRVAGDAVPRVLDLPSAADAPELAGRGADLVLAGSGAAPVHLGRGVGPRGERVVRAAAADLARLLG